MTISILAFGVAKEIFAASQLSLELGEYPTVGGMKKVLEHKYPRLAGLASYMVAVNNEYADDTTAFDKNDEVAIIPPVSGG